MPGAPPFVRGSRPAGPVPAGWDVRQRHREPDAARPRPAIVADLENGVTSIWLAVGEGGTAPADLDAALAGVYLDLAPVVLDAGPAPTRPPRRSWPPRPSAVPDAELLGTLGLDPIGLRARTGSGPAPARWCAGPPGGRSHPRVRAIVVDALPVHAAGGSDAQELGCSLAAGVAYLRELRGRVRPGHRGRAAGVPVRGHRGAVPDRSPSCAPPDGCGPG